jgi:glycosyltransferase involved in cell wall biosynthesis
MTGMGEIVPIGDHHQLAQAIIRVLDNQQAYLKSPETIAQSFSPDQTAEEYIRLFIALSQGKKDSTAPEPAAYDRLRQMRDEGTKS